MLCSYANAWASVCRSRELTDRSGGTQLGIRSTCKAAWLTRSTGCNSAFRTSNNSDSPFFLEKRTAFSSFPPPESNLSSCTSLAGYRNSAGTRSWLLRCPFSSPDHFVKAFDHLSHPGVALSRAGRAIEPSLDAQLPAQSNAPGSQKKKCQQRHFHAAPAALHRRCGSHMGSYAFAESLNLWSLSDWSQATTLRTYHLAVIPSVAFTESLGAQAAPQVHSSGLCALGQSEEALAANAQKSKWFAHASARRSASNAAWQVPCCHASARQVSAPGQLACRVPSPFVAAPQLIDWMAGSTNHTRIEPIQMYQLGIPHFGRSTAARPLPETWCLGGSHHLSGVRAVPGRPPPPSTLARAASKMFTPSLLW